MRIDWNPQLQPVSSRREPRGNGGDGSFARSVAGETAAAPASSAGASQPVDGLFLLQEVEEELNGKRRAAARGTRLLDRLENLRVALLSGSLPRSQLEELRQLTKESVELTDDPKLAEIVAEIELRAAVELAKLDQVA